MAIRHLNMQFLCKKHISFSACTSLIIRRCFLTNFTPSSRFAYSRCENLQRRLGLIVLAEITRLRQYIRGTIVYFLNRQARSNLGIFGRFTLRRLYKKSIRCIIILALLEQRVLIVALCKFVKASPVDLSVASGNRFLIQK